MNVRYGSIGRIALATFLMLLSLTGWSQLGHTQGVAIDPQAEKILRRMTDYLSGLKRFSVRTQVTLEDLLESGHRVDFDISTRVLISRPNKLRAERKGDVIDQIFYYDGKTLTLYNPADKVYAAIRAPGTIEDMLHFAHDSLGLGLPAADLVHQNAFPLLMKDVTNAVVVGKAFINGVKCDHLLFSRPDLDFQVWVADKGRPLPYKYVVTDRGSEARISIVTVMSEWNSAPAAAQFNFVAPKGAKPIIFLQVDTTGGTSR